MAEFVGAAVGLLGGGQIAAALEQQAEWHRGVHRKPCLVRGAVGRLGALGVALLVGEHPASERLPGGGRLPGGSIQGSAQRRNRGRRDVLGRRSGRDVRARLGSRNGVGNVEHGTLRAARGRPGDAGEGSLRFLDELHRGVLALLGLLGQRASDDIVEPCRQRGHSLADLRRRRGHVGKHDRRLRVRRERHHSGQAPIEDRRQAVDVAERRRRLRVDLLWRDVVERPDELSGLGQPGLVQSLGEAEVRQVGVVARADEDVVRLDVAVDEIGLVGEVERFCHAR